MQCVCNAHFLRLYNIKTTKPTAICYLRQNARVLLSSRVQYKEQINKFVKQKQLKQQQQKRQILKRSKSVQTVNCVCVYNGKDDDDDDDGDEN